jgi:hypothetical protein
MPSEHKTALTVLGKGADFKDGVLKVVLPFCRPCQLRSATPP